jgi:ParB/RepB/Spo0J family partition protein
MQDLEIQNIPIDQIAFSSTNPRKRIDTESISDLAESIQKNGLIQPVTIRPADHITDYTEPYELVAGERRVRACKVAGMSHIAALVRPLTDEEAFDIQVVENLQRKDIHPLDEAEGFQRMLKTQRFSSIKDVAERVGKSESFVSRRLKLNDLAEPFREMLYNDEILVGHAMELCRISKDDQKALHDDYWERSFGEPPTVKTLKRTIANKILRTLSNAIFDPKDDSLTDAGPCITCPSRSGANRSLFPDVDDHDRCFNGDCFQKKHEAMLLRLVRRELKSDQPVYFASVFREAEGPLVDMVRDEGYQVLVSYDDFHEIWDEEEEKVARHKVFYLNGDKAGRKVGVRLKEKASVAEALPDEEGAQMEIERIQQREERAQELDREKVQKALIEFFSSNPESSDGPDDKLQWDITMPVSDRRMLDFSMTALYLDGIEYNVEQQLLSEAIMHFGIETPADDLEWSEKSKLITSLLLDSGADYSITILRSWYLAHCTSQSDLDPQKSSKPRAFRSLVGYLFRGSVDHFQSIQKEVAVQRKERVEQKLDALRETITEA